ALLRCHDAHACELFLEVILLAGGTFVFLLFEILHRYWKGKCLSAVQTFEFVDRHIHLQSLKSKPEFYYTGSLDLFGSAIDADCWEQPRWPQLQVGSATAPESRQ